MDEVLYLDIFLLVTVLIVQFYVFYSRFLKLEFTAVFTLLLYYVVILIRLINSCLVENEHSNLNLAILGVNVACHSLISIILYYFIFEMKYVVI